MTKSFRLHLGVVFVILALAACSREPQKVEPSPPARSEFVATTTLLATISDLEKPAEAQGMAGHGAPPAGPGPRLFTIEFSEQGGGVAYTMIKDGKTYVVHNGKIGRPFERIDAVVLSPDGKRVAYQAQTGEKWCVVADEKEGQPFDSVGVPRFSPDSRHIVYNATRDKEGLLVADGKTSAAFPSSWDELFSGDSNKIISIQNSANDDGLHRVVIYDLNLKSLGTKELHAGQFVYNKEKNRIAGIAVSNGKMRVVELSIDQPDMIKEGPLYDEIMFPSFGPDGTSLAYFAAKGGKSYLVLNEKEEPIPAAQVHNPPLIRPDGKGAGIILHTKNGFVFRQAFVGKETIEKMYDEAAQPVYSGDGSRYAYIAKQKKRIFLVVNGKECPAFDMVVSPLFSPDRKFIVYRARKDGKRFVVVADASGKILKQHPAYEQVFQPVFSPDGKSVAYGVKDGNKLVWTVEKLQ